MVDTPTSEVTVLGAGLGSSYQLVPLTLHPSLSTGAVNRCWGPVPFPICYISLVPPAVSGSRWGLSCSHPPVHVFSNLLHNRTFSWTFERPVSRKNKNWLSKMDLLHTEHGWGVRNTWHFLLIRAKQFKRASKLDTRNDWWIKFCVWLRLLPGLEVDE